MDPSIIKTAEQFEAATGFPPQHDDLARVNCPYAGALGHLCCGWNHAANKPQFMCGPAAWDGRPMPRPQ